MAPPSLEPIFNAKSVAVVGASNRRGSVGNAVFANLLGTYRGLIYPVNSKERSILGVHAYASLAALPTVVDLIVVAVPTAAVVDLVRTAGKLGVKGAVVISAGFKEVGEEGAVRERELQKVAREFGISVVGPNCLGVINASPSLRMNASFATKMPKAGNIAFVSQSGALCTSVLDEAERRNMGFSKFISIGNKADISECDILRFLRDDEETRVICMYLEDISDGAGFLAVARDISWGARKPILVLKSGTSVDGQHAASSHTGALAGSEKSYDAAFKQAGILRVKTINELCDSAQALSMQPVPAGLRVAIITNAGGPGIIATDALEEHGLLLARFSAATEKKLKAGLPSIASTNNPVDIIGDARQDRYQVALEHCLADEGVDGVIVILTPQSMTEVLATAQIIPPMSKLFPHKPVLCAFMGARDVAEGADHLQDHGVPNYAFPEAAVRSLAAMARFGQEWATPRRVEPQRHGADRAAINAVVEKLLGGQQTAMLHQAQAGPLLRAYGLPVLDSRLVEREADLEAAVKALGFPLVMKISSPDIVHKSEAGGVKLRIRSPEEARKAFLEILQNAKAYKADARISGVYVEQMAQEGVEVIIGARRDARFGPTIMFGLGGTFVEVFKDVTFRVAPMWQISAEQMLTEIKAKQLLDGVRGRPASDSAAIVQCILRVAQLMVEVPLIEELDINPMLVYGKGQGSKVVDCRMLLSREAAAGSIAAAPTSSHLRAKL